MSRILTSTSTSTSRCYNLTMSRKWRLIAVSITAALLVSIALSVPGLGYKRTGSGLSSKCRLDCGFDPSFDFSRVEMYGFPAPVLTYDTYVVTRDITKSGLVDTKTKELTNKSFPAFLFNWMFWTGVILAVYWIVRRVLRGRGANYRD